jgi:hypothetical protein
MRRLTTVPCNVQSSSRLDNLLRIAYHFRSARRGSFVPFHPRPARSAMAEQRFLWDTKHYQTLDAYSKALLPFPKPAWVSGITIHHSYRPTRAQWHGHVTMEGTRQYYINKGWTSGPHLFLAALTPGPFNDGIWAGTPLSYPGTHAGACNDSHIGVEVVGDYDVEFWPDAVADLVYGTVLALMRWGHIAPTQVHGHRECLKNKSCPGTAIDMNRVRTELAEQLTNGVAPAPPAPSLTKRYRARKVLISQKSEGGPPYAGELAPGEEVTVDKWYAGSRMVHIATGIGFCSLDDLEPL